MGPGLEATRVRVRAAAEFGWGSRRESRDQPVQVRCFRVAALLISGLESWIFADFSPARGSSFRFEVWTKPNTHTSTTGVQSHARQTVHSSSEPRILKSASQYRNVDLRQTQEPCGKPQMALIFQCSDAAFPVHVRLLVNDHLLSCSHE